MPWFARLLRDKRMYLRFFPPDVSSCVILWTQLQGATKQFGLSTLDTFYIYAYTLQLSTFMSLFLESGYFMFHRTFTWLLISHTINIVRADLHWTDMYCGTMWDHVGPCGCMVWRHCQCIVVGLDRGAYISHYRLCSYVYSDIIISFLCLEYMCYKLTKCIFSRGLIETRGNS